MPYPYFLSAHPHDMDHHLGDCDAGCRLGYVAHPHATCLLVITGETPAAIIRPDRHPFIGRP